jgi:hypothetical protein
MLKTVLVKGSDIYESAVAGAKRGYNRSTDDNRKYKAMLRKHNESMLKTVEDVEERKRIIRHTGGNWRHTYLPLSLAMFHSHIGGEPAELHARVYLSEFPTSVFDIPLSYWKTFEAKSDELLSDLEGM